MKTGKKNLRNLTLIILFNFIFLLPLTCNIKIAKAGLTTFSPQIEYLKTVNDFDIEPDNILIFLLAAQYINTNQFEDGIEFFNNILDKRSLELSSEKKAVYLSATGLLRGLFAVQVPLINRIGWVNDTIDILETARELTNNEMFLVRWSTGLVYAELPLFFNKKEVAIDDLNWSIENISKAPHMGWLRELYFHLALIFQKTDDAEQSNKFLEMSGFESLEKTVIYTTANSTNGKTGSTFHPKRLTEVIPEKIFNQTGYEFTEFYFIVSDDKQELIAIDAGTRPDSARAAYENLKEAFPDLPELTTVFITHSHWDHIGGHQFYRELNPDVVFYARDNYKDELELVLKVPFNFNYFFGTDFKPEFLAGFKPDELVSNKTEVIVGGTLFELIPISGGETGDGMLINMPDHSTLFSGDFIMPYLGAPFNEEGNIPELFETIDLITELEPLHLLHGHEALTRIFSPFKTLADLKPNLEWLYDRTLQHIKDGMDRPSIHKQNLIPPGINQNISVQLPYIILRENFINRIFDQNIGYWQPDLTGLDHLDREELGSALVNYLNITEQQLNKAVEDMVDSGDHELAGWLANIAITKFPDSAKLKEMHEKAFLKLKEKFQEIDPFKFILYSEVIDNETKQLD